MDPSEHDEIISLSDIHLAGALDGVLDDPVDDSAGFDWTDMSWLDLPGSAPGAGGSRPEAAREPATADHTDDDVYLLDDDGEPAPFAATRAMAEAKAAGELGPILRRVGGPVVTEVPNLDDLPTEGVIATIHDTDARRRRFVRALSALVVLLVALTGARVVRGGSRSVTASTPPGALPWHPYRSLDGTFVAQVPATPTTAALERLGALEQRHNLDVPGAPTTIRVVDPGADPARAVEQTVADEELALAESEAVPLVWGVAVRATASTGTSTVYLWAAPFGGRTVVVETRTPVGASAHDAARAKAIFERLTESVQPA